MTTLFSRVLLFVRPVRAWALAHRIWAGLLLIAMLGGGYYWYRSSTAGTTAPQYTLAVAEKGTLVVTVNGTGQVSVSDQIDEKTKASGDVIAVPVVEGQTVKSGDIIAKLDATTAAKALRDAQANLDSAKLSLEKLQQPADALSMTQAQNALMSAQQSKQNATDDLTKAYDDGFTAVSNAFLDLPGVVVGLNNVLSGTNLGSSQANVDAYFDLIQNYKSNAGQFRDVAKTSYAAAKIAYDKNLEGFKNASRFSDRATIDALINETYETTRVISEAIKNANSFLSLVNDTLTNIAGVRAPAILATHQNNLQGYAGTTNSNLSSILNIKNTIQNDKDTITASDRTIAEKTESLAKLKAGADQLDVRSQELAIQQRVNALRDAQENFADYFVRAPFDGVLAKLNVKKGDSLSSGFAAATVISNQQIAGITLNEVDIAKVKLGQKATFTFDAVADLTITGTVVQMDTIGTVSQGVVTYGVKMAFDMSDDRVRPGMSVTAAIITATSSDTLLVPGSAVKTQGTTHYVEMLDGATPIVGANGAQTVTTSATPRRQTVEVGLSNDTLTEIVSGLTAGDLVITKSTNGTKSVAAPTSGAGIRIPGLTGGSGR